MRYVAALTLLFAGSVLWAQVHYAKLQPYQTYVIKAAAAGRVVKADDRYEGKTGDGQVIVQIDDATDRAQKEALEVSLEVLQKTLALTQEMAVNQERVYEKDRRYYLRIKPLKTKSQTEKDRVFATMMASHNQLLTLREKVASLRQQIADTRFQIFQLKDRIAKKAIRAQGLYIYRVAVRRDDYVNPGTLLLKAMDLSKGRLVVYLDAEEVADIAHKRIYIDGRVSDLRFEKLIKVADDTHLSSYRGEIIVPHPGPLFSKLMTIEVK